MLWPYAIGGVRLLEDAPAALASKRPAKLAENALSAHHGRTSFPNNWLREPVDACSVRARAAADATKGFTRGVSNNSSSSGSIMLARGNSRFLSLTTVMDELYALSTVGCETAVAAKVAQCLAVESLVHDVICSSGQVFSEGDLKPLFGDHGVSTPSLKPSSASCWCM